MMLLRSFPSSPLTPIHTTFRIVKQHSRDQKGEDIPKGTWEYFPAQWEIICLIPYMDLPHDALKGSQMAFIKQDGMRGWVDRKWIEKHTDELEDNQILLDHLAKKGGGIRFSNSLLEIDEDKLSKGVLNFWKMFWDNHWQPIPTPYEEIDWARHLCEEMMIETLIFALNHSSMSRTSPKHVVTVAIRVLQIREESLLKQDARLVDMHTEKPFMLILRS